MMLIDNTLESYVRLWQLLESTREQFTAEHRRYCVRRILHHWMPLRATDCFIWEVCWAASDWEGASCLMDGDKIILGLDILPHPSRDPLWHREFLRALTQVVMGIPRRQVDTAALDRAYSIVFPHSTPLNVAKKRRD